MNDKTEKLDSTAPKTVPVGPETLKYLPCLYNTKEFLFVTCIPAIPQT